MQRERRRLLLLNMQMVAEGVETAAQAEFLRSHGVQYAPGGCSPSPSACSSFMAQLRAEGGPRPGD